MHSRLLVLFVLIISSKLLAAQTDLNAIKRIGSPFIETFSKDEFNGQDTNYMGLQGADGYFYFGNARGILQYDGLNWRLYGGLDDNYNDLVYGPDGRIYLITKSNLGYYEANTLGDFEYVSLDEKIPDAFSETGNIDNIYLSNDKELVIKANEEFLIYSIAQDSIYFFEHNKGIEASFIYDNQYAILDASGEIHSVSSIGSTLLTLPRIKNPSDVIRLVQLDGDRILAQHRKNVFKIYDKEGVLEWASELTNTIQEYSIVHMIYEKGLVMIATQKSGVFILDLTGNLVQRLTHQDLGENDTEHLFVDANNNLWVVQLGAIHRVYLNSPYTILDARHGADSYILDMERVGNYMYLGTRNGIKYKKVNGPWMNFDGRSKFKQLGEDLRTQIFVEKDNKLFAGDEVGLVLVDGLNVKRLYTGEKLMGEGVAMKEKDRLIYGSSLGHLHVFEKVQGNWEYRWQVKGFQYEVDFIEEAGDGSFWVTDSGLGIIKVRLNAKYDSVVSIKKYGPEQGLPSVDKNRVYEHKNGLVFLTQKGLYKYDLKSDRFIRHPDFLNVLEDNWVIRFTELADGSVMSFSRKGIENQYHFLRKSDSGFTIEEAPHQLIKNFGAEYITAFDGEEAWIGSAGLRHFNPSIKMQENQSEARITKVSISNKGDSVLYMGNGESLKPVLKAGENALRFDFTSAYNDFYKTVQFQSYLDGSENDWNEWSDNSNRFYTNLSYGNYVFKVRAKNIYGDISEIATYSFRIQAPWFLTVWAYIFYVILFILFIWFVIKRYTARLKRKNEQLELVVKERTQELREQANKIRKQKEKAEADKALIEKQAENLKMLDELKSRFFANISHELRTPLTLINAPLQTIIEEDEIKDKALLNTLKVASKNGQNLLELVEEILDLTKLEAGKLELQENPVYIVEAIELIVEGFADGFKNKSIQFSFESHLEEDIPVLLDERKFSKILVNLLSNALKFTPEEGKIELILEELGGQQLSLSITDNGIGIHPDDINHVFDRFYQSEQKGKKAEGGTGIGLALVKELAQLMGGRVFVESELGTGTTFNFEFPKTPVMEELILPMTKSESSDLKSALNDSIKAYSKKFGVEKPVLLITEDHPEMRDFLSKTLQPYFEIKTAPNGKVALEVLREHTIDVLISDVMMPVMDGFELLQEIKKDQALRLVSIIMLTARADQEDKLFALTLGIDDYLTKPFNASEFLARIKNILDNRVKIIYEMRLLNEAKGSKANKMKSFFNKHQFSDREAEVLVYMAQRKSNAEIAEAMFVSVNTIKYHLKNIYGKLDIKSRYEAVEIAKSLKNQ